jgi:hypothetical protein
MVDAHQSYQSLSCDACTPRVLTSSAFQTYVRLVFAALDDAAVELRRPEFAELVELLAERSRGRYGVDWGGAA